MAILMAETRLGPKAVHPSVLIPSIKFVIG
jgi:hypothetical protein